MARPQIPVAAIAKVISGAAIVGGGAYVAYKGLFNGASIVMTARSLRGGI